MKQAHCRTAADIGVDHDKIFNRVPGNLTTHAWKGFLYAHRMGLARIRFARKKLLAIGSSTTGITYYFYAMK